MRGAGLAITLVVAVLRAAPQPPTVEVSAIDLLELYGLGEFDAVSKAVRDASRGDLVPILEALRTQGREWIDADGTALAGRRRLAAATFALEVAEAGLANQWARSQDLVEWACSTLRNLRQPLAPERTFHLAAIALMEGAGDIAALGIHLSHARSRFPDEPRLLLAEAFRHEVEYWRGSMSIAGQPTGTHYRGVAAAYAKAAAHPANRREAALRLGHFFYRAERYDEALEHLHGVGDGDDEGQRYLRHLFTAWIVERSGDSDEAVRQYRLALDAVPGGQSASLSLAALLFVRDRREEAERVIASSLEVPSPAADPWRIYGYGDLRRFEGYIRELRGALQ